MKIGYARVSTKEQHLDMQLEALKAAGCEKIFSEKMTGRQQNRPELDACLNFLREGDTLVVYKLDRLGRSLKNILTLLEDFKNRGIQFTSLQDNISTEGAIGQLMNNILGAFAQFERDLIYERTQEGRRIAKEKGVKFGRKTLINKNNIAKQKSCIQLYESGTPVREIQKILNIGSSGTVYRLLRRNGITLKSYHKVTTKKRNAERYSDRIELQGFQSCFRLFVKPSQSPLKPNQDAATLLVRNHARNGDKRTRITKQGVKD